MIRGIVLAIVCLVLAGYVVAQSGSQMLVPVWTGARYIFPRLGPTLVLQNNQLDVLLPPTLIRRCDVLLVYDRTASGWKLPAGASNVAVYVNGLRYRQNHDYTITAGVIKSQFDNMLPEFQVVCDYDTFVSNGSNGTSE